LRFTSSEPEGPSVRKGSLSNKKRSTSSAGKGQARVSSSKRSPRKQSISSKKAPSRVRSPEPEKDTFLSDYIPQNPPFYVVFVVAFAAMILVGALLLWLPKADASGGGTAFSDALFTAASAVSCTGLTVVDTGAHWSHFGQAVILVLIQLGGFGFMLISSYLLIVLGTRVHLLDFRFSDAVDTSSRPACVKFALQTIALTLLFEGIGVLVLHNRFDGIVSSDQSLWNSVFHSISAFNNAGFNILDSGTLATLYSDNYLLLTIGALVILGGVSAPVLINVFANRRWKGLNLNAKIALTFTVALLAVGVLGLLVMEYGNDDSLGPMSVPQKIVNAFFCSANARTAGFSSMDLGTFGFQALALIMILMFVGGVAGSTAGGIKVNSFGVLLLTIRSYIMGHRRVHAFGRQIPEERVHEAITVFALSILVVCFPVLILAFTENLPKLDLLFESFSAFGTVGLSTGVTSALSVAGRLVLAFSMFIGRLGPLTIVLAISERRRSVEAFEPEESVKVW
jgi:trk system potassium uptake protein TrkH